MDRLETPGWSASAAAPARSRPLRRIDFAASSKLSITRPTTQKQVTGDNAVTV